MKTTPTTGGEAPGAAAELPAVSSDTANRALGIYYQMMPSEAAKLTDELRERMRCVLLCIGADAQAQLDALREEVARLTKERDEWHDENTMPAETGWFAIKRADGSLCLRAFGAGDWWIPLKDGWLSGLPAGFRWFGPLEPVEWDTPHAALKAQPTDVDALMALADEYALRYFQCIRHGTPDDVANKNATREALRAKLAARKEAT